ncbi:MAG TPA: hypothetical protein VI729_12610 [Anaerolineales bacterium]|nr:hypothetical protein [Anaerolineales bacterium]
MMTVDDGDSVAQASENRRESYFGRVIRFLSRLLLVVLLGVGVGAAAYFGAPAIYHNYIEPVQVNSQRIVVIEAEMAQGQADNDKRDADVGERLARIEGGQASQTEQMAELQAQVEELQAALEQQGGEVKDLQQLVKDVDALKGDLGNIAAEVEDLQGLLSGSEAPLQELDRRLQLIRVMELMTRARLWLIQNNLGLASEDAQAAVAAMESIMQTSPDTQEAALQPIVDRLNLVLQDLPASPVVAADDLEIAWDLILSATERPTSVPE